jgi:hypothetical protein
LIPVVVEEAEVEVEVEVAEVAEAMLRAACSKAGPGTEAQRSAGCSRVACSRAAAVVGKPQCTECSIAHSVHIRRRS